MIQNGDLVGSILDPNGHLDIIGGNQEEQVHLLVGQLEHHVAVGIGDRDRRRVVAAWLAGIREAEAGGRARLPSYASPWPTIVSNPDLGLPSSAGASTHISGSMFICGSNRSPSHMTLQAGELVLVQIELPGHVMAASVARIDRALDQSCDPA